MVRPNEFNRFIIVLILNRQRLNLKYFCLVFGHNRTALYCRVFAPQVNKVCRKNDKLYKLCNMVTPRNLIFNLTFVSFIAKSPKLRRLSIVDPSSSIGSWGRFFKQTVSLQHSAVRLHLIFSNFKLVFKAFSTIESKLTNQSTE